MNIQLVHDRKKRLYEQIYEYIRDEIMKGKLLCGEKLPSTRSLAEYLSVSRATVDYAYDQLLGEGYIESRPSKGYYICSVEGVLELEGELSEPERSAPSSDEEHAGYEVDFSPNKVDMSAFPYGVWGHISRNIMSGCGEELFSHGDPKGDYSLRDTICRYLHSSRGVECSPEQIIVGAGNEYLLMLLDKIFGKKMKNAHSFCKRLAFIRIIH